MRRICCIAALAALGIFAGFAVAFERQPYPMAPCCGQHVIPELRGQGCTMPADFTLTRAMPAIAASPTVTAATTSGTTTASGSSAGMLYAAGRRHASMRRPASSAANGSGLSPRYPPLGRAAGRGVELLGNAACSIGQAARLACQPHGPGHSQRFLSVGDARVEQHAVDAQFHGRGHVAGRAHARIDDHRIVGSPSFRYSRQMRMALGLSTPCPEPMGLPAGITLAAPAAFNRLAITGSSLV